MKRAVEDGRSHRPDLEVGICGDPKSIALCHQLELNDITYSPFRVCLEDDFLLFSGQHDNFRERH